MNFRCGETSLHWSRYVPSTAKPELTYSSQDTNLIQYELMNLFAAKNRRITVVGDPDQSIYGFRAAEIRNLERLQKRYTNTSVVLLEDNYRSSGAILDGAQEVIEQDVSRPTKKLQPTLSPGTLPVLRKLPTAASEAEWLVLEIKRCVSMSGKLLGYSDFAILLRSAALSRQIETAMGRAGVPYRMVGGSRFYDRIEIKLLLDYMRVVSHTGNSDALVRIINAPPRSIGEVTIRQLVSGAEAANMPVWNFVKDVVQGRRTTEKTLAKSTNMGLRAFVGLIEACRQKLVEYEDTSSTPRTLLEFIISKLSFQEYLTIAYPLDEESRWANVEELLCQAADAGTLGEDAEDSESLPEIEGVEQQKAGPAEEALQRFLANVALSTEPTEREEQTQEKVTLSTIHAAKGLEWPVVFVPSVYEGIIPHSRAEDCDEERRLLYVAMTRAKAFLYISYPLRQSPRGMPGDVSEVKPTSFLPAKTVKARFRPTGPNFSENVVYEMAKILDRQKPSAEDMLKGLETTPRVHDDKWTAEGQNQEDVEGSSSFARDASLKRRRCDPGPSRTTYVSSSGYTLGQQQKGLFPAPPTTILGGFSSAREYAATQPRSSNVAPAVHSQRKSGMPNDNRQMITGWKAPGSSQGSMSQSFGGSESKAVAATASSRASKLEQLQQSQSQRVNGGIPHHFLEHRVPTAAAGGRILAPSDANKYAWLTHNTSKPLSSSLAGSYLGLPKESDEGNNKTYPAPSGREFRNETEDATEEFFLEGKNKKKSDDSVKSTTTFYMTTMSMPQQPGGAATAAGGCTTAGRKALGVRRRNQGVWEERVRRERAQTRGR